ncbi:hypothetical protein PR048_014843 [Dryococelus australis]|uniref:DUF5641 domain-containing protein n=1 Tax=Dryococelus australis TaxID=614101 RepID=A0ABQ9HFA2_9NEOP|nr:hypothetical protein PR048_014843 [Dryococelus australis]
MLGCSVFLYVLYVYILNPSSPDTVLQMLIVTMKGKTGEQQIRILIDTGSQRSYIIKELVVEMGYQHCLFSGRESIRVHQARFRVTLGNICSNYVCNFDILDQDIIGSSMPTTNRIECQKIQKETGIKIKDDGSPVQVLVGTDVAGKLLTEEKIVVEYGLVAVNTYLGWTLMGTDNDNVNIVLFTDVIRNHGDMLQDTKCTLNAADLASRVACFCVWVNEVNVEKNPGVLMNLTSTLARIIAGTTGISHSTLKYCAFWVGCSSSCTFANTLRTRSQHCRRRFGQLIQKESFDVVEDEHITPLIHFEDGHEILRIKTNISERKDVLEFRNPAILPADHPVVMRLVYGLHVQVNHKFWILRGRQTVRSIIRKCTVCRRFKEHIRYLKKLCGDLRKRFCSEYLRQLVSTHRSKGGRSIMAGEVVLVGSDQGNLLDWPLAVVEELVPGRDGVTRAVRLRTASGVVTRPVQRVYPLERICRKMTTGNETAGISMNTRRQDQIESLEQQQEAGRKSVMLPATSTSVEAHVTKAARCTLSDQKCSDTPLSLRPPLPL